VIDEDSGHVLKWLSLAPLIDPITIGPSKQHSCCTVTDREGERRAEEG